MKSDEHFVLSTKIEKIKEQHGARMENCIVVTMVIVNKATGNTETVTIRGATRDASRGTYLGPDGQYHYVHCESNSDIAFAIGDGADEISPQCARFLCEDDQAVTTEHNRAKRCFISGDAPIDDTIDVSVFDCIADPCDPYAPSHDTSLPEVDTNDPDLLEMLLSEKTVTSTYPAKAAQLTALRQIIPSLRKTKKSVVIMRGIGGMSNKEITDLLNDERLSRGQNPYSESLVAKHWMEFCNMVADACGISRPETNKRTCKRKTEKK